MARKYLLPLWWVVLATTLGFIPAWLMGVLPWFRQLALAALTIWLLYAGTLLLLHILDHLIVGVNVGREEIPRPQEIRLPRVIIGMVVAFLIVWLGYAIACRLTAGVWP